MTEQTPATDAGTTAPAGEDLSDHEMAETVSEQTAPDRKAADVFEREAGGTDAEHAAADETADDLE